MKTLVIIVTYNAMKWIDRCLGSVQSSLVGTDTFVVDNGSTDGTQEYINEHYPKTLFHRSEINLGFGRANNIGLQYSIDNEYDYVYLLNQDAWIMPETIGRLIEISMANPEYGILSPFQMSADLYHIDNNFFRDSCMLAYKNEIVNDAYNGNFKKVYDVPYVMAAHWLMPIKVVKVIGGFSPTFPHYGEDCNYIDRALFRGYKIGVVPSLKAVHDRGDRVDSIEKKLYIGYTGSLQILSNPSLNNKDARRMVLQLTIRNMFKYKSFKPVLYLKRIALSIRSIKKNRETSKKQDCAFLKAGSN